MDGVVFCATPGCGRVAVDVVPGGSPVCAPCATRLAKVISRRAKRQRRARRANQTMAIPKGR